MQLESKLKIYIPYIFQIFEEILNNKTCNESPENKKKKNPNILPEQEYLFFKWKQELIDDGCNKIRKSVLLYSLFGPIKIDK